MIKVDLVTGFLGSGKTTFIRKYAGFLAKSGQNIGIIENDFGAVNVDMLLLQDLESDNCELEPIVGGNVEEDWKRRFKAKLVSMAMRGFDRIIVEPSGIYDVDTFFDVLYEEPLDRWYEVGTVFALVDAKLDERLSEQAKYLLTSQIANAGKVLLSKAQEVTKEEQMYTMKRLNEILKEFNCNRSLDDTLVSKDWNQLTDQELQQLADGGYVKADHKKLWFDKNEMFTSLFFLNLKLTEKRLCEITEQLMKDTSCGTVFRLKGFVQQADGNWRMLNATHDHLAMESVERGQEVVIVIGQNLVEETIRTYFDQIS